MNTTLESIRLNCSGCGNKARVPATYAGRRLRCTKCAQELRVPGGAPEEARGERRQERRSPARDQRARATTARRAPVEDRNPYAPPRAKVEPKGNSMVRGRREDSRNRDMSAEAHVHAVAIWTRVQGLILGLLGLGFLGMGLMGGKAIMFAGPMALVIGGLGVFLVWQGLALRRYQNWARWVSAVFIGLSLLMTIANVVTTGQVLGNVLGLAWQGANVWALFGARANRSDGSGVAWWSSPFFYLPVGLTLLGILVIFGLR